MTTIEAAEQAGQTKTYYIATDAGSMEIEAVSLDVAAAKFAESEGMAGVDTAEALRARVESVGGIVHALRAEDGSEG